MILVLDVAPDGSNSKIFAGRSSRSDAPADLPGAAACRAGSAARIFVHEASAVEVQGPCLIDANSATAAIDADDLCRVAAPGPQYGHQADDRYHQQSQAKQAEKLPVHNHLERAMLETCG